MPNRKASVKEPFSLQSKENSQQLHDKLTNILERFEETRQAIKDNVKMLESVSDATTSIDSPAVTGHNTIDSSSSYPYSFGRQCRSLSSNRLSGTDTSGTFTSLGLRTISSVDSGVMLTLTSSSETGTQSRSRSFGSWTGGNSPEFLLDGKEEDFHNSKAIHTNEDEDVQVDSSSVDSNLHYCSDSTCSEEEEFDPSPYLSHKERLEELTDNLKRARIDEDILHTDHSNGDCRRCTFEERVEKKFEVQENSISFEEQDETYHTLSLPISLVHSKGIVGDASQYQLLKPTVLSPQTDSSESRKCIVLPAKHKEPRMKPATLNFSCEMNKTGRWIEKDCFTTNKSFGTSDYRDVYTSEERPKVLERSGSTDSRLMFSPIPEESSSDLVPNSPSRAKKSMTGLPFSVTQSLGSDEFSQRNAHSVLQQRDQNCDRFKKSKRRRNNASSTSFNIEGNRHRPLSSSTSSSSSVLDTSHKSDALSLSSYRNAIDKHAIALPQILQKKNRVSLESSSSSTSSYSDELLQTSSSSSSDSDPEYDMQVSLHNQPGQRSKAAKPVFYPKDKKRNNHMNVPVLRKMSKDRMYTKDKSPATTTGQTHKNRLFKKHSSGSKTNNSKLQKTKSDEASDSLLRYFRFPSPPRTMLDDSSDSSHNKDVQPLQQARSGLYLHGHSSSAKHGVTGTSVCSCATSSTETCSELAYPGLHQSHGAKARAKVDTPTSHEPTSYMAQKDSVSGRLPHLTTKHSNKFHQPQHPDSPAADYPLPVQQLPTSSQPTQRKKHHFNIFSRIFQKKSKKKNARISLGQAMAPRLTLDLAGGEVRVKPEDSADSAAAGIPCVLVPSVYYDRQRPYQSEPAVNQGYYDSHSQQRVAFPVPRKSHNSPIYVVPVEQPHYVPVVKRYQKPYTTLYSAPQDMVNPYEHTGSYGYRGSRSHNRHIEEEHMRGVQGYPVSPGDLYTNSYFHSTDNLYPRQPDGPVQYYIPADSRGAGRPPTNQTDYWRKPKHPAFTNRRKHHQML